MSYTAKLEIEITYIDATTKQQADLVINEFLDSIGEILADKISWDNADWVLRQN